MMKTYKNTNYKIISYGIITRCWQPAPWRDPEMAVALKAQHEMPLEVPFIHKM